MNKKAGWKQKLALLFVSCLMIVLVLGLAELYFRWFTDINFLDNSRDLFAAERYGASYGNKPNFEGISFGEKFYTDENGFRVDPQFKSLIAEDAPAILIIGDSVAFGPALREEETLAGKLRRTVSDRRIYNAAAIGYDTFDYKNAVDSLIKQKPEIKTVLLFLCLNDINAVSAQKIRQQTTAPQGVETPPEDQSFLRPFNDFLRSRSKLYLFLKNLLRDTQMIYFKNDLAQYQQDETVQTGLQPLREIKQQLDSAKINFKVFVLPYETQLRKDSPKDFLLPQKKITDFLRRNEIDFYDATQDFKSSEIPPKRLFLYGDPMHLSEKGNQLLAEIVRRELEKVR